MAEHQKHLAQVNGAVVQVGGIILAADAAHPLHHVLQQRHHKPQVPHNGGPGGFAQSGQHRAGEGFFEIQQAEGGGKEHRKFGCQQMALQQAGKAQGKDNGDGEEASQELSELSDEEKKEYLDDLGVSSSGLDKLVAASYSLLGLISFLTAGEDECRAWTIKKGTKAPQAAGKIHTDFERGFIKAEVVNYQDLLDNGSLAAAREKGIVGMEGKDYVVKDGDVILFRFNV